MSALRSRATTFDVVMLTGVWHHLDERQRQQSMRNLAFVLRTGGAMVLTIRRGPTLTNRHAFEVSAEETLRLADSCGFETVFNSPTDSALAENREAGVTWTRLAFRKV